MIPQNAQATTDTGALRGPYASHWDAIELEHLAEVISKDLAIVAHAERQYRERPNPHTLSARNLMRRWIQVAENRFSVLIERTGR